MVQEFFGLFGLLSVFGERKKEGGCNSGVVNIVPNVCWQGDIRPELCVGVR